MSQTGELNQCVGDFLANGESDLPSTLECITSQSEQNNFSIDQTLTVLFLVYSASLVFMMQAGFAMVCSGCVRKKNIQNSMLKNLLDTCGSCMAFFFVGYGFAYGGDPNKKSFIGNTQFLLLHLTEEKLAIGYAHWLFQFSFAAASATIVAGTLAERCQMNAYLMYSMMLTGFVYPVVVHNIWSLSGYFSCHTSDPLWGIGMIDFAGSGVVHVTGGITALVASKLLGPRKGRFTNERGEKLNEPKTFPGHSKSLQMLGTFLLWFGWFGFNAGSAVRIDSGLRAIVIARAVVNTALSAASSGLAALFVNMVASERQTGEPIYNLSAAMNGCLAGLTAVTGSCGVIEPWAAVVIGFIAGIFYFISSAALSRLCIDDAVNAIPVHLVCGIWGVIATGLFANERGLRHYLNTETVKHVGWFYSIGRGSSDASLLACQVVGLLFILGWTLSIMTPFFIILNYLGLFRADSLEEIVGLDVSYHGSKPFDLSGDPQFEQHLSNENERITRASYARIIAQYKEIQQREELEGNAEGVDRLE